MPVFINEVVLRGDVRRGRGSGEEGAGGAAVVDSAAREALIAEVTQAVIDHVERELDRIGER